MATQVTRQEIEAMVEPCECPQYPGFVDHKAMNHSGWLALDTQDDVVEAVWSGFWNRDLGLDADRFKGDMEAAILAHFERFPTTVVTYRDLSTGAANNG